jgi:hypothetical protein
MAIEILIESQIQPFDNVTEFPATGAEKTIYITKDINAAYYWNGSAYILIVDPTEVIWGDIGGDLLNQSDLIDALNLKVDKVAGKGLSTEDYTTAEKSKLAGIQAGAQVNVKADWNATGGDTEILNKPDLTIYATNSALTSGLATKQDVLGFTPVSTARTLTINGVAQDLSADRSWTIATGLTVGTTPIASGAIGRVLFEGTGNVLQQSSSLAYDDTTKVFTLSANQNAITSLNVSNTTNGTASQSRINLTSNNGSFILGKNSTTTNTYKTLLSDDAIVYNTSSDISILNDFASGRIKFATGGVSTPQMTLFATGNFGINTTTDAGFRLDVNGTARFSGAVRIAATGLANTLATFSSASGSANIISFTNSDTTGQGAILSTGSTYNYATYQPNQINVIGSGSGGVALKTGNGANAHIRFYSGNSDIDNSPERMRLVASTGNVLINTTTDAGFRLDVNGTARVSSGLTTSGIGISTNGGGMSASGPTIGIVSYGGNGASTGYNFTLANTYGGGNANRNFFSIGENSFLISSFASGTNNVNWFGVYPVINNTGGTTISRGIYYNPTLTSLTGTTHYAFHSTSGRIRFENLPTSPTGLNSGELWNNLGILTIV